MSAAITVLGSAIIALLLAGYFAQKFMPPPKPKVVGIDLGTTYSCIGVYSAGNGDVRVIGPDGSQKCIPSVVAFRGGKILVGQEAVDQAETNPQNTIYDAKRFIGKLFTRESLEKETPRYQFKVKLDDAGNAYFVVGPPSNETSVSPEYIGSLVLGRLRSIAETNLTSSVSIAVISVPAEFDDRQRNFTRKAAKLAGFNIWRVISEPTAAALAYGLHKKEGMSNILVVDLGGGTLDVSLLYVQGGMFLTQAMAGNNHLGGQDFNERVMLHLLSNIHTVFKEKLTDPQDLQSLRQKVEEIKLNLTRTDLAVLNLELHSIRDHQNRPVQFLEKITRSQFEEINKNLFKKVLVPIATVLKDVHLHPEDMDEIVLVGGSTRIPMIRQIVRDYFNKAPNVAIDPDLAVVYGVSIQAGIVTNSWPVRVSAIELQTRARKIHVS